MNILWITWKDSGHPEAGGAEVVCREITRRFIADGHAVTILTSDYERATQKEVTGHDSQGLEGVTILRVGRSRYLHPFQALWYYLRNLRGKYDFVIEEVNGGAPYFSVFFERKAKRVMLYHQLGRKNWLYEIRAPFSYLGYYILVPLATWLVSRTKVPLITVSESTRQVMAKHGFHPENTAIISEGLHIDPIKRLEDAAKYGAPTVLSHGSLRAMKRTIDQIKAFEIAKKRIPNLQMKISGGGASSTYGKKVLAYIDQSPYKKDIEYLGRTTDSQKVDLMRRCHAILVTSVEEGWGLIVTETNSQGTPAVVYNVDGLRDSVRPDTGIITAENPAALADGIVALFRDPAVYDTMRKNAWTWSKQMTFDQSYQDFKKALGA